MPKGSADLRARQSAALAGVIFEKQTAKELGELISSLQQRLVRRRGAIYPSCLALSRGEYASTCLCASSVSRGALLRRRPHTLHFTSTARRSDALREPIRGYPFSPQADSPTALDTFESATVRDAARDYKRRTALSKEMAQREARLQSEGFQARGPRKRPGESSETPPVVFVGGSRRAGVMAAAGVRAPALLSGL